MIKKLIKQPIRLFTLMLLLFTVIPGSVLAKTITIDFDYFPGPDGVLGTGDDVPTVSWDFTGFPDTSPTPGDSVSDQYLCLGVRFSLTDGSAPTLYDTDVWQPPGYPCPGGPMALYPLNAQAAEGPWPGESAFQDIIIDFTVPVSRVLIYSLDTEGEEPVVLEAYNANGDLLGTDVPEADEIWDRGVAHLQVSVDGSQGYITKAIVNLNQLDPDVPGSGGPEFYDWLEYDLTLVADAGDDQTVECACQTLEGTKVTLDGTGSSDPDNDPLTYTWTGPFLESPATGATPTVTLDPGCLGTYEITLTVNDDQVPPAEDSDTVLITVQDTTPPDISCPGDTKIEAMGPDGVPIDDDRIQTFLDGASATDNCDPSPVIMNNAPAIFLPGGTTVTFTATDTSDNTSTCQSTVTVVEAAEGDLRIVPRVINRDGRLPKILAVFRFPEGVTEDDIDIDEPLVLFPGDCPYGIEATSQRIVTWHKWGTLRVSVFAFFSKDEVTAEIPEDGLVEFMVVGRFVDGPYFYGTDTVRIISWDWTWW